MPRRRPAQRSEHRRRRALRRRDLGGQGKHLAGAGLHLVDARIGYDLGKLGLKGLDVSLNANNLLDKDYVASCYSLDFCYFGESATSPRR